MAFNGHFEAHYERLGFYLDGNYMGMDFKPHFDKVSKGSSMELGIMDYGVSYRLFGSPASERVAHWEEKSRFQHPRHLCRRAHHLVGDPGRFQGHRQCFGQQIFHCSGNRQPDRGGILAEVVPVIGR